MPVPPTPAVLIPTHTWHSLARIRFHRAYCARNSRFSGHAPGCAYVDSRWVKRAMELMIKEVTS